MRGSLFKRCVDCGRVVQHKRCGSCRSRRYNWGYAVDIGTYADGRRRQQRRNGFETAEEAERALREVVSGIDKQSFVEPSQLTLGEYLTEHWLPAVQPPQLRATAWAEYKRMVRLRVVPELGQVPLQKLKTPQLNRLYAQLMVDGRADGTGGLSVKSVRETHVVIRKALARGRRTVGDGAAQPRRARRPAPGARRRRRPTRGDLRVVRAGTGPLAERSLVCDVRTNGAFRVRSRAPAAYHRETRRVQKRRTQWLATATSKLEGAVNEDNPDSNHGRASCVVSDCFSLCGLLVQ